jgi:very-short-patch-repair endonuclease/predicted transcriptional regulator of viral defense system
MVAMRPKRDTPIGEALARLASRRHGIVTLEQLRALGYSDSAIARLIRAGRLHRLYRGVFAVGHTALSTEGKLLAAVLACGAGAAISHGTAAWVWALRRDASARIHVTVPTTAGRRAPENLLIHCPCRAIESTVVNGIPVTTPMRTLADLSDTLPRRQLEKALEQAHALRLLDVAAIDRIAVAHAAGRRGPRRLQQLVRSHDAEHTHTRSALEDALLELCDRHGIPRPRTNAHIEGYEADFAWPEQRLIVEADSWRHHSSRERFERDRIRDSHHTVHGWRVVRLTHARITHDVAGVAALLARLTGTALTPRRLPPHAPAAG